MNNLILKYKEEVINKNKEFNLTSITDEAEFDLKHIKDSLLIFDHINWEYKEVLDIGTGAGIPGVILAIEKPETNFTLLDSTEKKINFINDFCKKNGVENVSAIVARAEEYDKKKFDLVISRAVAALPKMLELASHHLKIGGEVILYKGRNVEDEFCKKLRGEIVELGLVFEEVIKYNLDSENERTLVRYKKIKENKKGYPRLWKDIKKKDLCE